MADPGDTNAVLHDYLRSAREALLWKLDGLTEREARLPRIATNPDRDWPAYVAKLTSIADRFS
ncbi:hypothetical protein ABT336_06830 [Micromonospora sp. NPDC000207]|uniref:hypothetical protein n=1 Tax=Micromonospora sp. NPDC000207 TaxID=3154246 RepID=UPI00332A3969